MTTPHDPSVELPRMRLFDTHCHFPAADPVAIRDVLSRARAAGVERILAVGGSGALNESAAVAAQIADGSFDMPSVACAFGFDRDQAGKPIPPVPEGPLAAWGEIGLDYHYSADTRAAQISLFESQLEEARKRGLPAVIHTREADADTLAVLRSSPGPGVIHCFTGTPSFAKSLLDLGYYISFSGVVTFRAAEYVREASRAVPDDRILIETDSPYLAPEPVRGSANEPANVAWTCAFLAGLRGHDPAAFADLTFSNAVSLFS
jgi:TatD DNase family protein